MPFFLKPCLKLRRKHRKGKKEKDIQTFSDVTSHVTNKEIWKQYRPSSNTSNLTLNDELDEDSDNLSLIASRHSLSENDHLSINENVNRSTTEINEPNVSPAVVGESGKASVICHMAIIENNDIEDIKTEIKSEFSMKDKTPSRSISNESIKNGVNSIKECDENTSSVPSSNDLLRSKLAFEEKISKIISDITVTSDVFLAIEEIKANECAYNHDYCNFISKSEEFLDVKANENNCDSDNAVIKQQSEVLLEGSKTINFAFKTNDDVSENGNSDITEINEEIQDDKISSMGFSDVINVEKRNSQTENLHNIASRSNIDLTVQNERKNNESETIDSSEEQKDKNIEENGCDSKSTSNTEGRTVTCISECACQEPLKMVNFESKTNDDASEIGNLEMSKMNEEKQDNKMSSMEFINVMDMEKKNEQSVNLLHNALSRSNIQLKVQNERKNNECETIDSIGDQKDKNTEENAPDSESTSSTKASAVTSNSECTSEESLNLSPVAVADNLLETSENNLKCSRKDHERHLNLDFLTEDTSRKIYSTEYFPEKAVQNVMEKNYLDTVELMKKFDTCKNKNVSSEIPISEPTVNKKQCNIADSNGLKSNNVVRSSEMHAFKPINSDSSSEAISLSNDEEMNVDIYEILEESINIINKGLYQENDSTFNTNTNKNRSDLYIVPETDRNSNTKDNECISNKHITNVNVNRKRSNGVDINLESPCQKVMSQQIIDFGKFPTCTQSDNSIKTLYMHDDEDTESDSGEAEYCSEDSGDDFVHEDSEDETIENKNMYKTVLKVSSQNVLKCHKKHSNLISYNEDFPMNPKMRCNLTNTDNRMHGKNQIESDYSSKNDIRPLKMKVNKPMFDEDMGNADAHCFISENMQNNCAPSYNEMNSAKFENENKDRERNARRNNEILCFDKSTEGYSLKEHKLDSVTGLSELSEGDVLRNIGAKKSESLAIAASGDNKIIQNRLHCSEKCYKDIDETSNKHTVHLNINNKLKTKKEDKIKIHIMQKFPTDTTKDNVHPDGNSYKMQNRISSKEMLELKGPLKLSEFNEIENCLRQSLARFHRKKINALSIMKPELRGIPINKVHNFNVPCGDVENFSLKKLIGSVRVSMKPKPNETEKIFDDFFSFPILQRKNYESKIPLVDHKIMNNIVTKDSYSSESSEEMFSDISRNMTPPREKILHVSRAIRSPKYHFRVKRKASNNPVLYRTRPVLIKPSKLNLVPYLKKCENNVYQLKKGYRVSDSSPMKYKSSGKNKQVSDFYRYQSYHTVNNRATTPDDLKMKFNDIFRKYASKGRPNGELMSYKRSTEWLKDAGLIGKALTTDEANDAFKCVAGVKVALNKGDYRHFLKKLTRLKRLNYNDVYEKMCSVANMYAEG